jgi:hypothetical protein
MQARPGHISLIDYLMDRRMAAAFVGRKIEESFCEAVRLLTRSSCQGTLLTGTLRSARVT